MTEKVRKVGFWLVTVILAISPFFFLPLTPDFYEFNKQALLIVGALLAGLIMITMFFLDRKVRFAKSAFTLPLILVLVSFLLSTWFKTPNKFDALLEPGQTGTIAALVLVFIAGSNFIRTKLEAEKLLWIWNGSITFLAVLTLIWGSGLVSNYIPLTFLQSPLWSATGTTISGLVLIGVNIILNAALIMRSSESTNKVYVLVAMMFVNILGASAAGYRVYQNAVFMPQSAGWSVALEALKISPLLGTGPSNYLATFTRFRPVNLNLDKNWQVRFISSSNTYLQLLTSLGFLGLAAYLYLAYTIFTADQKRMHPATLGLWTVLAIGFVFPANIMIWTLHIVLLLIANKHTDVHEEWVDQSIIMPWAIGLIVIVTTGVVGYFGTRAYMAEIKFKQALDAALANKGKETYDSVLGAISLNPYRDTYRLTLSQTNLLIANAFAGRETISEDDKKNILQLVQQSVDQAKIAVALGPQKVNNHENLANIYKSLTRFAQGADVQAFQAYQGAITADPTNPGLHISAGGLFFAAKNYDQAIRLFQRAIELKPNYANAYYNLAIAYREKKDYKNAALAMQNVLKLVDQASNDYLKASDEFQALNKMLTETQQVPTPAVTPSVTKEALTTPAPLASPAISPLIPLASPSATSTN